MRSTKLFTMRHVLWRTFLFLGRVGVRPLHMRLQEQIASTPSNSRTSFEHCSGEFEGSVHHKRALLFT